MKRISQLLTNARSRLVASVLAEPAFLVLVGAPLAYWFRGRTSAGPLFLTDEIGYLSNAAFLAGHRLDAASSYHAGYSLFLTPLFIALSGPDAIWQGVIMVNCILLALALLGLIRLLRRWFPRGSPRLRAAAVFVAALYPAWLTMASHAYASCAMAAVFMWSLIALDDWRPTRLGSIAAHAFLVGFMFWVHPTGVGPIVASTLILLVFCLRTRQLPAAALHLLIAWGMVIVYGEVIHPWIQNAMTPPGLPPLLHYPPAASALAARLNAAAATRLILMGLGEVAYLTVSTFGLALSGSLFCVKRGLQLFSEAGRSGPPRASISAPYLFMSLCATVFLGALEFSSGLESLVHTWIHGRFLDPVAFALLPVGFLWLSDQTRKSRILQGISAAAALVFVGAAIKSVRGPELANAVSETPGFWPQYVTPTPDFVLWMLLGALGVLGVALAGRPAALVLMLASCVLASQKQAAFDRWAEQLTRSTSIVEVVRSNVPRGSCVGFDPLTHVPSDPRELRFQLFKFYLFDYAYARMTHTQWLETCGGPLLTRSIDDLLHDDRVRMIARDQASGIFLVSRAVDPAFILPPDVLRDNELYLADSAKKACLRDGCLAAHGNQLVRYTEVGIAEGSRIVTTGREGYLFFGPYSPMRRGQYYLELSAIVRNVHNATLDIVSAEGRTIHAGFDLCAYELDRDTELILPFELGGDVADIEVRLHVGSGDRLKIRHYEVSSALDGELAISRIGLCLQGSQLSGLAHDVGELSNEMLRTNARAGYLMFGPGADILPGEYHLTVYGTTGQASTAFADIVYNRALTEALRLPIHSMVAGESGVIAEGVVTIPEAVNDLEVRLHVEAGDDVRLAGYRLVPVTP